MATKMTKWNRIQATIRPTMSKESYRNWLAPVRFSHVAADKRLHLVAPNSDVQGWVESELGSAIVNAARTIGMDIRALAIETEAPEPRLVQRSFEFDPKPSPFNPKYRFERFVSGRLQRVRARCRASCSDQAGSSLTIRCICTPASAWARRTCCMRSETPFTGPTPRCG